MRLASAHRRGAAHLDGGTAPAGGRPDARLPLAALPTPLPLAGRLRTVRRPGPSGLPCPCRTRCRRICAPASAGRRAAPGIRVTAAAPGRVLLALTRDRSGRAWRLADACAACAAATSHTAVVPDTLFSSAGPLAPACAPPHAAGGLRGRARRAAARAGDAHLPRRRAAPVHLPRRPAAGPAVRPARRCRGHVRLPTGLLRGMRLRGHRELWQELAHAGWLEPPAARVGPRAGCGCSTPRSWTRLPVAVPAAAPPTGRCALRRWPLPAAPPALRLTALVLAAHMLRRCRTQRRYGRPRPPVRAQPAADRRASRPAGDHPHTGSLAPQPGERRGALATAPAPCTSPPCSTAPPPPGTAVLRPAPGRGQEDRAAPRQGQHLWWPWCGPQRDRSCGGAKGVGQRADHGPEPVVDGEAGLGRNAGRREVGNHGG